MLAGFKNENYKGELILKEFCDKVRVMWARDNIDNIITRESTDPNYDPKKKMLEYCSKILKTRNGIIMQKYTCSNNQNFGRLYANGVCYQTLMREYRTILCGNGLYYDIDLVNAHAVILLNYSKYHKIECPFLKDYVEKKDEIRKKMMEHDLTKKEVKDQFISLLFGGSVNKVIKTKIKDKKLLKWLQDYNDEMRKIQDYIYNSDGEVEKRAREIAENKKEDTTNIKGSVTSYVLQHMEAIIIQCAITYLKEKKYYIGSLIHDGILVKKMSNKIIDAEVLKNLARIVKIKTGYTISFESKEFEGFTIPEEELAIYRDEDLNGHFVNNDSEGADIVITKLNNTIIKSGTNWYKKKYENANIYEEINEKQLGQYLLGFISNLDIKKKSDNGTDKEYSKSTKGALDCVRMTIAKIEDDPLFKNKLWESCFGKLCFIDGIFDFKTKTFSDYTDEYVTVAYINNTCKFYDKVTQEDTNELMKQIILPIFTDEKQRLFYMRWLSRALSGLHISEKTYVIGLGLRGSGKSVITDLCNVSFNTYFGSFNGEQLINVNSDKDVAKSLMWLIPHEYERLMFSNELKSENENGKKNKMDGDLIKSIASGGDEKNVRKLYSSEQTMKLQCKMSLFMNELIESNNNDSYDTLSILEFGTIFKNAEEITDKDRKINELNGSCRIYPKNNDIKELIKTQSIKDAFLKYIIDNYNAKEEHYKDNVEDFTNDEKDEEKILEDIFEFTFLKTDKLSNAEINSALDGVNINNTKLVLTLKKLGASSYRSNTVRGYTGIKIKPQ